MNKCCEILGKPKNKFIVNGYDLATNEPVQFHLPEHLMIKIREQMLQKPTIFQKIILWIMKLCKQEMNKSLTISFNKKTYRIETSC